MHKLLRTANRSLPSARNAVYSGHGPPPCPEPEPDDCGDPEEEEDPDYSYLDYEEEGYGNPVAFTCVVDGFEYPCLQVYNDMQRRGDDYVVRWEVQLETHKLPDTAEGFYWSRAEEGYNIWANAHGGPQKSQSQKCDDKLAQLFGGKGAAAATSKDLEIRLGKYWGKTFDRSGHLYKNGVFHVYTDEQGSDKEVGLFVPKGAKFVPPTRKTAGEYEATMGKDKEWQNEFVFRFSSGQYKGVSLHFVHVAGTYGGKFEAAYLGKEFLNARNQLTGRENEAGTSQQIGYIGGLAGEADPDGFYRHTHVVVKKNGKRIDPRKIFCREFGF